MPIAKESVAGPALVANLALVYAWTGEGDRALEQLEIVATMPAGPTYGDLRFNPRWDNLRGDPRFEKWLRNSRQLLSWMLKVKR